MERHDDEKRGAGTSKAGRILIVAAFVASLTANLIHNRFSVDAAIIPAAILTTLLLWRPRRWIQVAAAFFIAVPSLMFFKAEALASLTSTIDFVNHLFLLLAALLAVAGTVAAVFPARRKARRKV